MSLAVRLNRERDGMTVAVSLREGFGYYVTVKVGRGLGLSLRPTWMQAALCQNNCPHKA